MRGDGAVASHSAVFLEPLEGEWPPSGRVAHMQHRGGRFVPDFLVVERGSELALDNRDAIYHATFSVSEPNKFSMDAYPPGGEVRLPLAHAGVVRLYCRLHEDERAVVFVVPGRLALRGRSGRYEFDGVAPGRFRLGAWAEGAKPTESEITLHPGERAWRNIQLTAE